MKLKPVLFLWVPLISLNLEKVIDNAPKHLKRPRSTIIYKNDHSGEDIMRIINIKRVKATDGK